MAEIVKDIIAGMPWYLYLILIFVFGLFVASFVVPPLGAISPSVLQGGAIILGFTWLFYVTVNIPIFISSGAKIRATYKDATIEIGRKREESSISENNEGE